MSRFIPYGISNFEKLRRTPYVYVDKTPFLAKLESTQLPYVFFLRPRRFGKSLFCSMLEYYYDIRHRDLFPLLFGDTWIGQHVTPMQGKYLTLTFSFAAVRSNGSIAEIEQSFATHTNNVIHRFLNIQQQQLMLTNEEKQQILQQQTPDAQLMAAISLLEIKGLKLFLIIDEYDNFANNILVDHGELTYKQVTHGTGFLRTFFSFIKKLTRTGGVDRLFVTGVSPLVMADVTSGFNIGSNLSDSQLFATAMGFTEKETQDLLIEFGAETHLDDLRRWYNGYTFSLEESCRVYNSNMVLYFLQQWQQNGMPPRDMLDTNIRTDYGKLRHLITINNELGENYDVLRELLDTGGTSGFFVRSFAFGERIDGDRFRSFLYYLGLTTFATSTRSELCSWRIPNTVIEKMLWSYIRSIIDEVTQVHIDTSLLMKLIENMSIQQQWEPALSYIFERFYLVKSSRDFSMRELGLKMFVVAYLNLSSMWIVKSEEESPGGFADITLTPTPIFPVVRTGFILEFKYITSTAEQDDAAIDKTLAEAKNQLNRYKLIHPQATSILRIAIVAGSKSILRMKAWSDND